MVNILCQDPQLQSLQSLSIGDQKNSSLQGPPPGFSQVPPTNPGHMARPQAPFLGTGQLIIPPLSAGSTSSTVASSSLFGSNELSLKGLTGGGGSLSLSSSKQPGVGLSLSSLATSHLASTGGQTNLSSLASTGGQTNLSSLASNGGQNPLSSLASTGGQSNLSSFASTGGQNLPCKPTLSSLASSHLGSEGSEKSTFTIPSIFGKKKEESSDQPEINLMSALKLDNDNQIQEKKTETNTVLAEENILNINILVPQGGFDSIRSILRKKTKSPFSFTLTR